MLHESLADYVTTHMGPAAAPPSHDPSMWSGPELKTKPYRSSPFLAYIPRYRATRMYTRM